MAKKKLERNEEQAVLAGVLSGLAKYFDQDPALFRLIALVFLILTWFFPGILIYMAAWVVMPKSSARQDFDYEVVE